MKVFIRKKVKLSIRKPFKLFHTFIVPYFTFAISNFLNWNHILKVKIGISTLK